MPNYKDYNNQLHFIESGEYINLLPAGCIEITDAEADAIRLAAIPVPTQAEILAAYTAAIQARLDDFAKTRGYDGILPACTYATSSVPKFAAEGQYAEEARDATWAKSYEILAAVEAGTRPMPTIDEIMLELPLLAWPV